MTVAAYRGEFRVQISARFESYQASPVLLAPGVPGLGEATIDAQLQGGGVDAFLAEIESG